MSKRKGMSAEDKRQTMLEMFHESSDVYVIKDIEKLGVKRGIVYQSIKDVLQSLIDDDMVHVERIGASNYYWSFPAEASVKMQNNISAAENAVKEAKKRKTDLQHAVEQEKLKKDGMVGRAEQTAAMRSLEQQVATTATELARYRDNDPETVEIMRQGAKVAKDAANRWLDNLQSLRSWCNGRFQGREGELGSFFEENGFTDTLEYLE